MRNSWLLLLGAVACTPKIPSHLAVPKVDAAADAVELNTLADVVRSIVGDDPLVRAPTLPTDLVLSGIEGSDPIRAWAAEIRALEQGNGDVGLRLQQLEDRYPHTEVVPFARGYRLRMAENRLTDLVRQDGDSVDTIATLLTPLHSSPASASLVRDPFTSLALPGESVDATATRRLGDQWVLGGWLHDPELHTDPAIRALGQPQWSELSSHPLGRILTSRAGESDVDGAFQDLERATLLALERVAADRDREQAAWAETKLNAREELGTDEPELALLDRAFEGLLLGAAEDDAAGGAWLATSASRWVTTCERAPCGGLDRTESMRVAARWGPRTRALSSIWVVIALKDAFDTMDVGHDTILFPTAAMQLTDALLGTGAGPLSTGVLRRSRADEAVWLGLSRAVGSEGSVDWPGTRVALGGHLEDLTRQALALHADDAFTPFLERIAARAVP